MHYCVALFLRGNVVLTKHVNLGAFDHGSSLEHSLLRHLVVLGVGEDYLVNADDGVIILKNCIREGGWPA